MTKMSVTENSGTVNITVKGHFTFEQFTTFSRLYEPYKGRKNFTLNFKGVSHMDDAGLGLLILLRIFAGEDSHIIIQDANSTVQKILEAADMEDNFHFKT